MASEYKNEEEDDYNSSSDEDYDPEKDTDVNPQDEIDDAEGAEEDTEEDIDQLQKEAKSDKKAESSSKSSDDVDVDALFAELTGQTAPSISKEALESDVSTKSEEKAYPKSTIASSSGSSESTTKAYPKKADNTPSSDEPSSGAGKKRIGLLDAAKSLSKRSKISVLERSDQDWKDFTTEHNIKEDLESHNRGKGGYLNKMEFLNRTDNRQFEKERAFRATARKDTGH